MFIHPQCYHRRSGGKGHPGHSSVSDRDKHGSTLDYVYSKFSYVAPRCIDQMMRTPTACWVNDLTYDEDREEKVGILWQANQVG